MASNNDMCATCRYCEHERPKERGQLPKIGYCYGMPPILPGQFRPTVGLKNISCSKYEVK